LYAYLVVEFCPCENKGDSSSDLVAFDDQAMPDFIQFDASPEIALSMTDLPVLPLFPSAPPSQNCPPAFFHLGVFFEIFEFF
jgi:hypothetical protein